jgi:Bacterial SH3 domain
MNFEEAEAKFRDLQARVQRGEAVSRAEYEDQVSQLAVQDRNGVLWEINPRTGKWMYFDGAEWVSGTPPGHDASAVIPIPGRVVPPPGAAQPAAGMAPSISASYASPAMPPPSRPVAPPVPPRPVMQPSASASAAPVKGSPEALKPYVRPQDKSVRAARAPAGGPPGGGGSRSSPLGMFGPNREWVPLAIGAVVLLLCAVLLIVGSQIILPNLKLGSQATPTKTLAPVLPATPIPTRVALPTLPAPTATPAPVLAKVIEVRVNVRAAPSTTAKIVSSLKKDAEVALIGRNGDGQWYQINLAGGNAPAWVFGATLQISSGDPNTLPVVGPPTPTPKPGAPPVVQPTPTLSPLGTLPTPTAKAYP